MTGEDEIVVQGDVCDSIIDFIQEKWPEVVDTVTHDVAALLCSVCLRLRRRP